MATTWSSTGSYSAKAVCTTANEAAPSAADEGFSLACPTPAFPPPRGFAITAEADDTRTLSGSGSLAAYLYDDVAAAWCRAPDLDLFVTVSGARRQAWQGFSVTAPRGRVAFVPVSVGVSAGGLTIYVNASP